MVTHTGFAFHSIGGQPEPPPNAKSYEPSMNHLNSRTDRQKFRFGLGLILITTFIFCATESCIVAQSDSESSTISRPAPASSNQSSSDSNTKESGISMLSLVFKGGWFMLPLAALSVMIVIITVERILALRSENTMPQELVQSLGKLSTQREGFDPRRAYRICQEYPSIAARVVQSLLLKVGRPIPEIESTVSEAAQREADRVQGPIRWLELSAAIAPLIGLLGTVWGVTQAFYEMTQLTQGQNKGEALAAGIYTALITTICGLMIAIPALVMYKVLEGRIASLFHRVDELILSLIPQVERFEGQIRFADPSLPPEPPTERTRRSSDDLSDRPRKSKKRSDTSKIAGNKNGGNEIKLDEEVIDDIAKKKTGSSRSDSGIEFSKR